jgi:hypothetical protein
LRCLRLLSSASASLPASGTSASASPPASA